MRDECCSTILHGRLQSQETDTQPFFVFRIQAIHTGKSTPVGECYSSPTGDFNLSIPASAFTEEESFHLPLTLQVIDGREVVVCRCDTQVEFGENQSILVDLPADALQKTSPLPEAIDVIKPLLVAESVRHLRETVQTLVESGDLESGAQAQLERHLRPLEWVEGLLSDARQVLNGSGEAAERLRALLLSLLPEQAFMEQDGTATSDGAGVLGEDLSTALTADISLNLPNAGMTSLPDSLQIVHHDAMITLVAAATSAAADVAEAQDMLNALAVVLSPRYALDLILRTTLLGIPGSIPGAMKPLMSGPGPGLGLPGGINFGGVNPGGLPGGPGIPGWPKGPGLPGGKKTGGLPVSSPIGNKYPDLIFPINDKPTQQELCLMMIPVQINRLHQSTARYEILSISNPIACPGEIITLKGKNFGSSGSVLFPSKGMLNQLPANDVPLWTDQEIRVRVPIWAAPGIIRLQILIENLEMCGKVIPVYRLGTTVPYFNGGRPVVQYLWVDGEYSDHVFEPDVELTVDYEASVGTGVVGELTVWNGSVSIFTASNLPGGTGSITFRTPPADNITQPTDLRVALRMQNHCGFSEEEVTITVAKQPRLEIAHLEVTQAIQRLDNTVRLVARRRTLLRVYLLDHLGKFNYAGTGDYSALPNITGLVTIFRDSQKIAEVQPVNAPFTNRAWMFPYAREGLDVTLNFDLPWALLSGPIRLDVRVWVANPKPKGLICKSGCSASRSVSLNFEPVRGISLVRVLINDDSRGRPAPSLAEWQTSLTGAMARFPVPDDGWDIRILPGYEVISMDNDLSTDDGWDNVLEDLDDVAGDSSESWNHRWAGLLPAKMPGDRLANLGIGTSDPVDRPWPLSNDYMTFAALAGRPDVFAHELGHTFGIDHAGCADTGNNWPDEVDSGLPPRIEDYGVDLYTRETFTANSSGDLMSYCDDDGLWPSIVLWHRLIDKLR